VARCYLEFAKFFHGKVSSTYSIYRPPRHGSYVRHSQLQDTVHICKYYLLSLLLVITDGVQMVALVGVTECKEVVSRMISRHFGRQLTNVSVLGNLKVYCFFVHVKTLHSSHSFTVHIHTFPYIPTFTSCEGSCWTRPVSMESENPPVACC